MLTLLDINRAIDRLGVGAFAPRALRGRLAHVRPPMLRCLPATVEVTPRRIARDTRIDAVRDSGYMVSDGSVF